MYAVKLLSWHFVRCHLKESIINVLAILIKKIIIVINPISIYNEKKNRERKRKIVFKPTQKINGYKQEKQEK